MPTKDVPLSKPIEAHGKRYTKAVLRHPTLEMYFRHGDPAVWVKAKTGEHVLVESDEVIHGYLKECLQEPDILLLESQGNLQDALAIKDAITGFFSDARRANSQPSAISSPSTSGSSASQTSES